MPRTWSSALAQRQETKSWFSFGPGSNQCSGPGAKEGAQGTELFTKPDGEENALGAGHVPRRAAEPGRQETGSTGESTGAGRRHRGIERTQRVTAWERESGVRILEVRDPSAFMIASGTAWERGYASEVGDIHDLGHALPLISGIPAYVPRQGAAGAHRASAMTSDSNSSLFTSSPRDWNQVQMFRQSR